MKKVVFVLSVFLITLCLTGTLYAETVLQDDYLDYHFQGQIAVYEGYSIYGLKIVDISSGDISQGFLAINTLMSSFPFVIVGLEDSNYWSFTIQGYWTGNGTVGYLSTNNVSAIDSVKLSIGEQRR